MIREMTAIREAGPNFPNLSSLGQEKERHVALALALAVVKNKDAINHQTSRGALRLMRTPSRFKTLLRE